jgi:hypothetical protein
MATSAVQLGPDEFAAKIKAAHPAYAEIPNTELSQKVLAKYPQYWQHVDPAKFAEKGIWQPSSTAKPAESTGKVHEESEFGKNMTSAVGAASPVLATAGGVAGGALGGPPGAVLGAAEGGAVGNAIAQHAEGTHSAAEVFGAGATQGALEYLGGTVLPKALEKVGVQAAPRVFKAINNYIGLKPADLPKWGRTVEESDKIASTVLNEAGVKKTLPMQRDAIEAARALRNSQTEKIVASPAGRLVDLDAKLLDRAVELDKAVSLGEFPETTKNMIDANLAEMQKVAGEHGATAGGKMLPSQMHAMRKSIQQQIKDWNPETTNPRQWFLQRIYHDLNDSIAQGLPTSEATAFRANNKIQTELIVAREAAKEKILAQELKPSPGILTRAARVTGGAMVGAGSGTLIASETGQNKEHGAIVGGLIGAGLGSYGRHLAGIDVPASSEIAAQKAIAKAAPYLAKAAKYAGPNTPRAVQAVIDSIRSRPSQ